MPSSLAGAPIAIALGLAGSGPKAYTGPALAGTLAGRTKEYLGILGWAQTGRGLAGGPKGDWAGNDLGPKGYTTPGLGGTRPGRLAGISSIVGWRAQGF